MGGDDQRRLLLPPRTIGVLCQPDSAIEVEGLVLDAMPDCHARFRAIAKRGDEGWTVGHGGSPKRKAPTARAGALHYSLRRLLARSLGADDRRDHRVPELV